jgi:hypothetical protein
MGFLNNLFGTKNIDWQQVKTTDAVYPKTLFSLFTYQTDGGMATGWVDKGYKDYSYKTHCPYHLHIIVDCTDSIAEKNPDLDMGMIEDFFTDILKPICICHMVARKATSIGMDIEMYIETSETINELLLKESTNPDRLFSFSFTIKNDPKWNGVKDLMNIK